MTLLERQIIGIRSFAIFLLSPGEDQPAQKKSLFMPSQLPHRETKGLSVRNQSYISKKWRLYLPPKVHIPR